MIVDRDLDLFFKCEAITGLLHLFDSNWYRIPENHCFCKLPLEVDFVLFLMIGCLTQNKFLEMLSKAFYSHQIRSTNLFNVSRILIDFCGNLWQFVTVPLVFFLRFQCLTLSLFSLRMMNSILLFCWYFSRYSGILFRFFTFTAVAKSSRL